MKAKSDRLEAYKLLLELFEKKISLSHLLNQATLSRTRALCYGFCRHYYRVEAIADLLLKKRPKDKSIWLLILLGLYQLFYMHEPEYAVVKETVDCLSSLKKVWAKALVNAVLRNACREKEKLLVQLENNEAYRYGHPKWLLNLLKKNWPQDWQNIVEENDKHPPMFLRINRLKNTNEAYLKKLEAANISATLIPFLPEALLLEAPTDVQNLPGFKEGEASVQDGAAQIAAHLLDLKPGLRLLDACAAPGGKACHIVELEPHLKSCFALDVDKTRLLRIEENVKRLGLSLTIKEGDVLNPESFWDGEAFDRILLDAPCSALGVIRRHPDIKILRTEEALQEIQAVQAQMLKGLWPLLKKGGYLVYATCSIVPSENSEQIKNFLEKQKDAKLKQIQLAVGKDQKYGWQILPGEGKMDGFFYAVIEKC